MKLFKFQKMAGNFSELKNRLLSPSLEVHFLNGLPATRHYHPINQINLSYLIIKKVINFFETNRNIIGRLLVISICNDKLEHFERAKNYCSIHLIIYISDSTMHKIA